MKFERPTPIQTTTRWTALLLIAVALLLGILAVKRAINGNADLSGNYRIWKTNLQQATLPERREGPEPQDPDAYPPITYALFAPLGALPLWATATLWYVMNLGCSVYLWREARAWLKAELATHPNSDSYAPITLNIWQTSPGPQRILNLAVLAVLPAWIGSLLLGQNMLPLMALTWGGFQWARRQRSWLAGSFLALAAVIKILPAVFLAPFILTRHYRVIIAFGITALLLVGGLGSVYFGPSTNLDFHRKWLKFAVQGPENRKPDPLDPNTLRGSLRFHNQAIEAVLARLLMDVPIHNQPGAPQVNLLHVSAATWRTSRTVASALCLFLGLVALSRSVRRGPHLETTPASATLRAGGETSVETFAILSLLLLFISPIVWSHYYIWLFWPLLWLLEQTHRGRRSGWILYFAWLLAMPLMAVPQARAVGLHLWLTLAIFFWICWPRFSELRGMGLRARSSP